HSFLHQLARMQYRAVIASSKCVTNFIQGGLGKFARKKHRHLPRKGDAGRTPLACHIGHAHIEMFGYTPLNLFDRDRLSSFFLQTLFASQKLDVVYQEEIDLTITLAEFHQITVLDGVDEFIDEQLTGNINHLYVFLLGPNVLPDRLHEVSLAETDTAINKQR